MARGDAILEEDNFERYIGRVCIIQAGLIGIPSIVSGEVRNYRIYVNPAVDGHNLFVRGTSGKWFPAVEDEEPNGESTYPIKKDAKPYIIEEY